jgi:hypothetical protein
MVIALGAYHGCNPGMGWPLAAANGVWAKRDRAVFETLVPLAGGHLLAMAAALLPFTLIFAYLDWSRTVRIFAGALVTAYGIFKLLDRRHPRVLARVGPKSLTLWSFLIATAHGAGLMLLPVTLGLCAGDSQGEKGRYAMTELMRSGVVTSLTVAVVHTIAMVIGAGFMAWIVYRWVGLRLISRAWLNLEAVWAASLVLTGVVSCALSVV